MSPAELMKRSVESEKRRFQDDPALHVLRWIRYMVEVAVGLMLLWALPTAGRILIEHKPLMIKMEATCVKVQDMQDTIRSRRWIITDHEKRITRVEHRMGLDK